MKRCIRANYSESGTAISALSKNLFWDNTDPKGETGAVFHDSDLRRLFVQGLIAYWESSPYKLAGRKVKGNFIQYLGLFGTGEGIKIKEGAFPLKKSCSQTQLIKDFAAEYSIPVVIKYDCIFSNNYSALSSYHEYSTYYDREGIERAKKDLYGNITEEENV